MGYTLQTEFDTDFKVENLEQDTRFSENEHRPLGYVPAFRKYDVKFS
jgi:hypothetical protein